jgi:[1-hydroxy-2-(trimethylamino)ethyl]phosphonate dioxygenase
MSIIDQIERLFDERGDSQYGFEAVSQLEHALQAAAMGEREGASPSLIAAALLHDVGHLLHNLPDEATEQGIDDRHEELGQRWLQRHFDARVTEPVRLHVDAKRYLCAIEPDYEAALSEPSKQSMAVQGGAMTDGETRVFAALAHCEDAVRLRRWDDAAKVVGRETPSLQHFLQLIADSVGCNTDTVDFESATEETE